jgi:hypothetical protein
MLGLPTKKVLVGERIKTYSSCRNRFKTLVGLIDPSTVPTKSASAYASWTK